MLPWGHWDPQLPPVREEPPSLVGVAGGTLSAFSSSDWGMDEEDSDSAIL